MEYKEAVKKIQAKKVKDNYLLITLSYSTKLILPYKDGIAFMTALMNAEQIEDTYNQPIRVKNINRESISVSPLAYDEYEQYKISALLNITLDEVKTLGLNTSE